MTAQEMEYEWKITYEAIASMAAPGYTSREISVFLTQAQEEIAVEFAQNIDKDDYSRTVLEKLLTAYSNPTRTENSDIIPSSTTNRVYNITKPATFFHPFIEFAVTSTGTRSCKPIDYESYYTNISNPWSKPYVDLYWRLYHNGYLMVITDGTVLTNLKGLYVAKPDPIITANISPNTIDGVSAITDMSTARVLNPIVHREIVYRAAKKAFAAQKDQTGYQIQNNEENS